jgi:hypothetical protein
LPRAAGGLQGAARQREPAFRVRGRLTEGVDRPVKSLRTLGPGARLGHRRRHARTTRPTQRAGRASPVRRARRTPCPTLWCRARQRKGLRVLAGGQRRRHVADHVAAPAGGTHGERGRRWCQDQQAGWQAGRADPQRPVTSPLGDQAHEAIERKLCAMPGVHHPGGSPPACLTGLAHRSNLVPSQRRAHHGGHGGVEVGGGT